MKSMIESVCVFGSAARSTNDSLSDRDVLIVASDKDRLVELNDAWTQRGWSVAAYSPERILSMIERGSLFIQHLKFEGIIVADRAGWLARVLEQSRPKDSYKSDLWHAFEMLRPVERVESTYWSDLLVADLCYVYLRNAGIYILAEENQLEFDFNQIIEKLVKLGRIPAGDSEALRQLRPLKAAYRNRDREAQCSNHLLQRSVDSCAKLTQRRLRSISVQSPIRKFKLRYATIRDIEASMACQYDLKLLDKGAWSDEMSEIWSYVTKPRNYSLHIRKIDGDWINNANRSLVKLRKFVNSNAEECANFVPIFSTNADDSATFTAIT